MKKKWKEKKINGATNLGIPNSISGTSNGTPGSIFEENYLKNQFQKLIEELCEGTPRVIHRGTRIPENISGVIQKHVEENSKRSYGRNFQIKSWKN